MESKDRTLSPDPMKQKRDKCIRRLRQDIIESIKNVPDTTYEFFELIWDDAERWYGVTRKQVDIARIGVNLETKKLYNFLGDYEGRKQGTFDLTVKEFQSKIQRVLPNSDLCFLEEEDWVALFDDELNAAISEAQWRLSHPEEKKEA